MTDHSVTLENRRNWLAGISRRLTRNLEGARIRKDGRVCKWDRKVIYELIELLGAFERLAPYASVKDD